MQKKLIKKKIEDNQSVLFVFSKDSYQNTVFEILDQVSKGYGSVCYVTLNKFYCLVKDRFLERVIDPSNFVFIDGVSHNFFEKDKQNGLYFTKGPHDLIMINTDIAKACVNHEVGVVFIDSLSEMLFYQDLVKVSGFISYLEKKLKSLGIKFILTCNKDESQQKKIDKIKKNFDVIVKIKK